MKKELQKEITEKKEKEVKEVEVKEKEELKEEKEEIKEKEKIEKDIKEKAKEKKEEKERKEKEKIEEVKEKKEIVKEKEVKEAKEKKEEKEKIEEVQEEKGKDLSSEILELYSPEVPSPHKEPPIPLNISDISKELLEIINKTDSEDTKAILLNCERCGENIVVPVPKKSVLESDSPEIFITYININQSDIDDQHCIFFEIDHDFYVKLPRIVDLIIADEESRSYSRENKPKDTTVVLINCETCNETLHIPVPNKIIEQSKYLGITKTPIVYVHKTKENKDIHSIFFYLDINFGIRYQKLSDLLII